MAAVDVGSGRVQALGVRTTEVERRALVRKIRAVAVIAPDERLVRKIQTKVSGWIEGLFVDFTGAQVAAGEPILSIYSPEVVAAQREYLLAREALDDHVAGADGDARGLLDSARTRLSYWGLTDAQLRELAHTGAPQRSIALHSPIRGTVTLKPVYQGMYVTPEMELYTVTDLSRVWIWAEVFENDIDLVRLGQEATIRLQSSPGTERRATVSFVSPVLAPATRTLRLRFDANNADGALKPGQYATAELDVSLGEALAVPADAVIRTGDRDVVFVESGPGRYEPRQVVLGRKAEDLYEVRTGLTAGERVVVSSQFLLDSESRVRGASSGPAHGGH
jgi:multidrug efflux pump subunit AcrA (membrane-fusion protein)